MTPKDKLKLAALRSAIHEGDSSGIARGDVFARIRRKLHHEAAVLQKTPKKVDE
jgi:hypothetical protein